VQYDADARHRRRVGAQDAAFGECGLGGKDGKDGKDGKEGQGENA
jgi:hypothetical protein